MSKNNTIILKDCLSEFINDNQLQLPDDQAFELLCSFLATKGFGLTFEDAEASITGGSQDGGIDSFHVIVDDESIVSDDQLGSTTITGRSTVRIVLIQSKLEDSFGESPLDKLLTSMPIIMDLDISEEDLLERFNPTLVERIMILREVWRRAARGGATIEVSVLHCCTAHEVHVSRAYTSKMDQLHSLVTSRVAGAKALVRPMSALEMLELYRKPVLGTLDLPFKEPPLAATYGKDAIGYLGLVRLGDYAIFIRDEDGKPREAIFEDNIRHFVGSVEVNNEIGKTVQGDYSRDFWWLNNGITVIASAARPFGKTLSLDDAQIVNGLQTSFMLSEKLETRPGDERALLVKVIVTQDKETIDKVIHATNNQNYVQPAVLRGNDDIQRRIEQFFGIKGYYYERRKNFYKNQGKPANLIISIQNAAQSVEAVLNRNSSRARSKPTSLVKEDTSYKKIFREDIGFDTTLKCCQLSRLAHEYVGAISDDNDKIIARNFKFHLARTAAALSLRRADYDWKAIQALDLDQARSSMPAAFVLLKATISTYHANNPSENIINMAKSKRFDDMLDSTIISTLGNDE
jgi:hypothetical protein